jgi:hypothetical protein
MTLTLYVLHVLSVPSSLAALPPGTVWGLQAGGALAVGLAFRAARSRGPLEELAAVAAAAARGRPSSGARARPSARPPGR